MTSFLLVDISVSSSFLSIISATSGLTSVFFSTSKGPSFASLFLIAVVNDLASRAAASRSGDDVCFARRKKISPHQSSYSWIK